MPGVQGNQVAVRSFYVRDRHAMFAEADFGGIFEDYYLHLMQLGPKLDADHDAMLKDALATITLHLVSRPRDEMTAWTFNFCEPALNLFVTGDSQAGNVVGRVFTEDVRTAERNLFFSQVTHPRNPVRKSTVEVTGLDVLRIIEQYYERSEQLPARLFRMGGDRYAIVVAQPDIDMEWFGALDSAALEHIEDQEDLGPLEQRAYHFACGCDLGTIVRILLRAFQNDPNLLLREEDRLQIKCPRCAGVFVVDHPTLSRYLESPEEPDPPSDSS